MTCALFDTRGSISVLFAIRGSRNASHITIFLSSRVNELLTQPPLSLFSIQFAGSDFYVCDFKGHCVAVFTENGTFQHRIGHEKITCFPNGIDISDAGDILIGDSHGNRFHVACFSRDGVLQSEFECPYVKVNIPTSLAVSLIYQ